MAGAHNCLFTRGANLTPTLSSHNVLVIKRRPIYKFTVSVSRKKHYATRNIFMKLAFILNSKPPMTKKKRKNT